MVARYFECFWKLVCLPMEAERSFLRGGHVEDEDVA